MTRGVATSNDLRELIPVLFNEDRKNAAEIARVLRIPVRTVYNILALWCATGSVCPTKRLSVGRPRLLDFADTHVLVHLAEQKNDQYISELRIALRSRLGFEVSDTTIWRTLTRVGYTLKEISASALERNEALRAAFLERIADYDVDEIVAVDESSCERNVWLRKRAWALSGLRACRKQHFARGKRYSILPAIHVDGMLDCMIIEGSYNTAKFYTFIEHLLERMQPWPGPRFVILMDNCPIHKAPEIEQLITSRGVRLEYLPPYSPDLNPIELAFSLLKSRLRRIDEHLNSLRDEYSIYEELYRQVFTISAADCQSFFYHCGYS